MGSKSSKSSTVEVFGHSSILLEYFLWILKANSIAIGIVAPKPWITIPVSLFFDYELQNKMKVIKKLKLHYFADSNFSILLSCELGTLFDET